MGFDFGQIIEKYKFCYRCGGNLIHKKHKRFICSSCKKSTYINPVPANGSILINGRDEIMLAKRKIPPNKGYWDTPGGFIDPRETAEESTIRELGEELTTKPLNLKYFTSEHDIYEHEGIFWPVLALVYTGRIDGAKIKAQDDISEIKFFKPNKIPYDKIAFDGVKRAIKKFINNV